MTEKNINRIKYCPNFPFEHFTFIKIQMFRTSKGFNRFSYFILFWQKEIKEALLDP